MNLVTFSSDITVELIKHSAADMDVVTAAWVSTKGERSKNTTADGSTADDSKVPGLINYLMRERHGCYDSETDVLTTHGWKNWPDVDGTEEFCTLNLKTNEIEYQRATHLIHKTYVGPMIKFSMSHVDLLVTPDHNMVVKTRKSANSWNDLHLAAASTLSNKSARLSIAEGAWTNGTIHAPELAELVGFIVADGSFTGSSISFHLHRKDKIDWLQSRFPVSEKNCGRFYLSNAPEELRQWAKQTYMSDGSRCFPRDLVENADLETAKALLEGYLRGDGSVSPTGKTTASTTSRQVVDDIQELSLKCGYGAVEQSPQSDRSSAYGNKPVYRITLLRKRNSQPKIGWTKNTRADQVSVVQYEGDIHCVTVPNGTLYVRRNGKPMWSGNSPFEHSYFTFYVKAPIFVWREHMRHRIASYNEESGRYKVLDPEFYIPARERKLQQIGKTGHYEFEEGTNLQYALLITTLRRNCESAYIDYQQLLSNGIAKEVARMTLPVNIYSSAYVTMNSRALMNFLSLRKHADDSHFPSYPQREIEMVAEEYEKHFAELMPLTHDAFVKNERVAP